MEGRRRYRDDHDPGGRPRDEPRQDPRQSRKRKSYGGQDFRDAEEKLEPPGQRRVHLFGNRGRRQQKEPAVSEERSREQHLQDPEHDVHEILPLLNNTTDGISSNRHPPVAPSRFDAELWHTAVPRTMASREEQSAYASMNQGAI